MYKKTIIRQARFPVDITMGEDTYWVAHVMNESKRIALIDDIVYYYRQVDTSVVHRAFDKKMMSLLDSTESLLEEYSYEGDKIKNALLSKKFFVCADLFRRIFGLEGFEEERARIIKGINRTKFNVLRDSDNTVFMRAMALAAVFHPNILGYISSKR